MKFELIKTTIEQNLCEGSSKAELRTEVKLYSLYFENVLKYVEIKLFSTARGGELWPWCPTQTGDVQSHNTYMWESGVFE